MPESAAVALPGPDDIHVWYAEADVSPRAIAAADALLGADERARAGRFVRTTDRARFVAAHAMQRIVLGGYLGVGPDRLEFERGDHSKPKLAGDPAACALAFNLSHSGNRVLVAVSGGEAVGVDIEELRADIDVPALARLVFSPAELGALLEQTGEAQRTLFFRTWVRKEAVLKAIGLGFSAEPKDISVGYPYTGADGALPVDTGGRPGTWGVRDVPGLVGCLAAVAAPGSGWKLRCYDWIRRQEPKPELSATVRP